MSKDPHVRRVPAPTSTIVLTLVWLLLAVVSPTSARAETADNSAGAAAAARAAARTAAARVAVIEPAVGAALRSYQAARRGLAAGMSLSVGADAAADQAGLDARLRRRELVGRVRVLYMSGGPAALYASVLRASDPADALHRMGYVQRVLRAGLGADGHAASESATTAARLDRTAARLAVGITAQVITAGEVTQRAEQLQALLAAATAELTGLSRRARRLAEAQAAAARLAALSASVARSATDRVAGARAVSVPADYGALYVAATKTCPGMPPTVLAAIGQVETGHGRNTATSYAGAQGPMQFLPATFAGYAVDGDADGRSEITSPADSIFTAARYLCANGAGQGPEALHRAIWHYNHAEWYVELVLTLAGQLAAA